MRFSIIKRKKNFLGLITNSQWAMLLFFVIFCIALSFIKDSKAVEWIMLLFLFGIFGLIVYRYLDFQKLNAEIVGKLIVEKDFIEIDNDRIYFNKIQSINFKLNHYLNERCYIGITDYFKPQYYIGKGNYFMILTTKNEKYEGEFLINSRLDFLNLKIFYDELVGTSNIVV